MKKILLGDELLIIFSRIGEKIFGIDIEHVVSILEPCKTRRVPLAPTCLDTIMNCQGNIVTLFDIRGFFPCGPVKESKESRVIYLRHTDINAGLLVDQVIKVDYISLACLETEIPRESSDEKPVFSRGVFKIDDDSPPVEWLDGAKIRNFLNELKV